MDYESTRVVVVILGFLAIFAIFAGACLWATRGSRQIETFLDELDDERAQKRRY